MGVDGFRRAALDATDADIVELQAEIRGALEGDSNDAEHDALVSVAGFFLIGWSDPEDMTDWDDEEDED